jgi:hypothetical protein
VTTRGEPFLIVSLLWAAKYSGRLSLKIFCQIQTTENGEDKGRGHQRKSTGIIRACKLAIDLLRGYSEATYDKMAGAAQFWPATKFACPYFFEEKPLIDANMRSSRK